MSTVNLQISSYIGFRNSFDQIVGPATYLQTIQDLEGSISTPAPTPTRTLAVSTVSDFLVYTSLPPSSKTVTLSNVGNSTLTVTSITFTSNSVTPSAVFGSGWVGSSTTINAGTSRSFQLSYQGDRAGEFVNSFTIKSNNDTGNFKVTTIQKVDTVFDFSIEPSAMAEIIENYGAQRYQDFTIIPYYGTVNSVSASLAGDPGYSVQVIDNQTVRVTFDANEVSNADGTYESVLSITVNGFTKTVNTAVVVSIDDTQYRHIASWISPASYDNSIVGMSYDIIGGVKTLTIGVGAGGNDTPEYTAGGSIFISTSTLGLASAEIIEVYPYWREVYKIELDGTENRYQANTSTRVKLSGDVAYASYFGEYESHGTICIVDDDSFGNLTVRMNHLRETAGTESLDRTLDNLTRSFYYYSSSDIPSRYANTQPGPILDGTVTEQFTGFYNNGQVVTSIVSLPN